MIAPTHGRSGLGRVEALDGVRGLAVLLVVASHLQPYLLPPSELGRRVGAALRGGWIGVDLFFVLSGFLITTLLLEERTSHGRVQLGAFYGRRAVRLLPALYVVLAAYLSYTLVFGLAWPPAVRTVECALLYVNNWQTAWFPSTVARPIAHLWSLSIEEQFYLVWPAILILFVAPRRRWTGAAVIGGAIVSLVAYRAYLGMPGGDWLRPFVGTDTRADALLAGALLSWLRVHGLLPRRGAGAIAWAGTAGLVALFCYADPTSPFWPRGGFTLIAAGVVAILLGVLDGSWAGVRFFELAPLRLLGRVSYGLYLWHHFVFWAIIDHPGSLPLLARLAFALGLTAALTAASWLLVERRAQRLRRRFGR